jgi:hypothetical protein
MKIEYIIMSYCRVVRSSLVQIIAAVESGRRGPEQLNLPLTTLSLANLSGWSFIIMRLDSHQIQFTVW